MAVRQVMPGLRLGRRESQWALQELSHRAGLQPEPVRELRDQIRPERRRRIEAYLDDVIERLR